MIANARPGLPPNPYSRQPVRSGEQLAGRAKELRAIKYYLGLTAAGQSPHLALIGQRGVGKTSLLNATEILATELKLLPVRLDMNEQKVKSPGEFWHDFYATLILTLAKSGCWGGLQSNIYTDLFRMMHARQQPDSIDKAVLQTPFALSCHKGELSEFVCTDALVVYDFKLIVEELKHKGYVGIALLIDEADCLGQNVPLLQMFRNIFQVVERCSLILAGTESVFPTISSVFSPVPRQFHRIDVKPFSDWPDTRQLVLNPLAGRQLEAIEPKRRVVEELHDLCGGDPSEVQLYCHHMYRIVEEGASPRMALVPKVFREVLREYRANATANVEAVLNAIERLPDKYLFESRWLSRRNLSLGENVIIQILREELKSGVSLSEQDRGEINSELKQGYQTLFNEGIIDRESTIHLVGMPLTTGFWKSFVEVEKGKRWWWNDDSYAEVLGEVIIGAIARTMGAAGRIDIKQGDESIGALESLRKGEPVREITEGFGKLMATIVIARDEDREVSTAVDITFQVESPAGRQSFCVRFLEYVGVEIKREAIDSWIASHKDILLGHGIVVLISSVNSWRLPSSEEMHRLAYVSGARLPEKQFGPSMIDKAVAMFNEGNISGCASIFEMMLRDKEDPSIVNNLGFCQVLLGNIEEGLQAFEKAIARKYDPLTELNKGTSLFLKGSHPLACDCFTRALDWIKRSREKYNPGNVFYVLILNKSRENASAVSGVPVDAALNINLWLAGGITKEDLEGRLADLYPERHHEWDTLIAGRT